MGLYSTRAFSNWWTRPDSNWQHTPCKGAVIPFHHEPTGCSARIRTWNLPVMSRRHCQLRYGAMVAAQGLEPRSSGYQPNALAR